MAGPLYPNPDVPSKPVRRLLFTAVTRARLGLGLADAGLPLGQGRIDGES